VLATIEDRLVWYNKGVQNGRVDARIVDALNEMIRDCNAAGGSIWAQSCYRDYYTQEVLYDREVQSFINRGYSRAEAEIEAAKWVKRPGQSEHNTGLVVDFNNCDHSFTDTFAHRWLEEHCAEYGFILRFPEGKEDVTGVVFESWHYRYVGVEAATEMMRDDLTLEEYCEKYGY
ncbi:MAG: M15 family metallopeptidase, partial [Clostridia bacterium]|nr:M15 family metallopeptidase [Clostridia bacterium]